MSDYQYYVYSSSFVVRIGEGSTERMTRDGTWEDYPYRWEVLTEGRKLENAQKALEIAEQLFEQEKQWGAEEKANNIMDSWLGLIDTIVHFEYDCSFEWRGETDGSHDSYQEDLNQYQKKAEDVLKQALSVEGVDKDRIIEKASAECRKREKEGGWGAARCWNIIRNVT